VYVDVTDDIGGAIFREKQLKGWSRKKKEALIRQQEYLLPGLSKRHSPQPFEYKPKKKYLPVTLRISKGDHSINRHTSRTSA
jgi:hypothetical protein